jgi:hypothetical protein
MRDSCLMIEAEAQSLDHGGITAVARVREGAGAAVRVQGIHVGIRDR